MTDLITRLRLAPDSKTKGAMQRDGLAAADALAGRWGRDDKMAIAAVRHCLGRMTYITSDCADWLLDQWPHIRESARAVIQRDIEEAFERDDAGRAEGNIYKALGWDRDRRAWERVRGLWAPALSGARDGHDGA